jgi:hypothetical protein
MHYEASDDNDISYTDSEHMDQDSNTMGDKDPKLYGIAKGFEHNTQFSTSCSNQLQTTTKQGGTITILSGQWAGQ